MPSSPNNEATLPSIIPAVICRMRVKKASTIRHGSPPRLRECQFRESAWRVRTQRMNAVGTTTAHEPPPATDVSAIYPRLHRRHLGEWLYIGRRIIGSTLEALGATGKNESDRARGIETDSRPPWPSGRKSPLLMLHLHLATEIFSYHNFVHSLPAH